jgi:hypothetical protein
MNHEGHEFSWFGIFVIVVTFVVHIFGQGSVSPETQTDSSVFVFRMSVSGLAP